MVYNYVNEDLKEINNLGKILNPKFEELFHLNNLNSNEKIFVYKKNNQLMGFIHINISYEIIDILNIVVNPLDQNKGIGGSLLNYLIDNAPKKCEKIMLEVAANNKTALNFYQKNGFKIINTRKNYYPDADALIMERRLI